VPNGSAAGEPGGALRYAVVFESGSFDTYSAQDVDAA
jgi:hypothetical protein